MAADTEREALARLIVGGDRYPDGSVVMDSHWREFRDAADRIIAAGYVSPSRHRAEVEALTAALAERDAAVAALAQREEECATASRRRAWDLRSAVMRELPAADAELVAAAEAQMRRLRERGN